MQPSKHKTGKNVFPRHSIIHSKTHEIMKPPKLFSINLIDELHFLPLEN